MYIGFNLKKADDLIDKVVEEYNNLGIYTSEQWLPVRDTLRREWVGPDEQDFERKLIQRLCVLYRTSYNLANNCTKTLAELSDQWVGFQRKNTLDGSSVADLDRDVTTLLEKIKEFLFGNSPRLKKNDRIIEFTPLGGFQNDTNRGLQNAASKANIQSAVTDFVNTVKSRTEGLFNAIETNQAFFGEQASAIKRYIEATGVAIAEVVTAVKDLNDALETLANSSYSTASSDVSSSYASAKSSMDASVDQLGNSRWV